jgi:methionyl-tRNA formyltransferase
MAPLRLLFAGTPEIALPALEGLLKGDGEEWRIVGVLTNPDAPRGRGRRLTPSPVKERALQAGVPVLQPVKLDADAREEVAALAPDLLVVVAYGRIFGPRFLELFPRGGINLHPSLLPRHRGPSPLQAAILAGDDETGVTIQYLAREMDAGAIILQERVPLTGRTTLLQLHDDLGARGAILLTEAVRLIASDEVNAVPQDASRATYCRKLTAEDGYIDWTESAMEIDRRVRALTPAPGVRCRWGDSLLQLTETLPTDADASPDGQAPPGSVVAVDNRRGILVQTADGLLAIRRLKLQARKELDFRSFLNGNPEIIGTVLQQANA